MTPPATALSFKEEPTTVDSDLRRGRRRSRPPSNHPGWTRIGDCLKRMAVLRGTSDICAPGDGAGGAVAPAARSSIGGRSEAPPRENPA